MRWVPPKLPSLTLFLAVDTSIGLANYERLEIQKSRMAGQSEKRFV